MNKITTKKITYSAIFLCLALVLPFFTGQIKIFGKMLNLMHVAIFLCGMTCGDVYGGIIGLTAPILRSLTFGMPNLYPNAVAMALELCAYGFTSGILYKVLKHRKFGVIISLILSMLIGRIVWGLATLTLYAFMGDVFTLALFVKGAFVDSVIGIILHLIIIPVVIKILERNNLSLIWK